ncbi:muconolactone Delta-isomerase family protein [Pseudarthrobacter sp. R1]|uniref:muconolactone Delta-isomerase family protein n=1 Tax=Pseudarthrobacter sp. R1 TaxID=2944934 RepID=UPI0035A92F07
MSEFLVRVDIDTGDLPTAEVERLRAAEGARAKELAAAGHIIALWRVPDAWSNYGLWRATDEFELTKLLDSLPLRPFMTVRIQCLAPHPNDPRSDG